MLERTGPDIPKRLDIEIRLAGEEYIEDRQDHILSLLETAVVIKDLNTSEVYGNNKIGVSLPTGEILVITPALPKIIISIAATLSNELVDLNAMTPEIEQMWIFVRGELEIDISETDQEDNPEDQPPLPGMN